MIIILWFWRPDLKKKSSTWRKKQTPLPLWQANSFRTNLIWLLHTILHTKLETKSRRLKRMHDEGVCIVFGYFYVFSFNSFLDGSWSRDCLLPGPCRCSTRRCWFSKIEIPVWIFSDKYSLSQFCRATAHHGLVWSRLLTHALSLQKSFISSRGATFWSPFPHFSMPMYVVGNRVRFHSRPMKTEGKFYGTVYTNVVFNLNDHGSE